MSLSHGAHGSLSLPARTVLLSWRADDGRDAPAADLHLAVRAAALAELARRGLLSDDGGIVTPVLGGRTGDDPLDALMELVEESRPRRWRAWMTRRSRSQLREVKDQLVREGHLRVERTRVLGVFPSRRYEPEDTAYVDALRAECLAVLRGPVPVTEVPEDDAALVVCAATGKLGAVVGAGDRRRYRERLEALTDRAGARSPELRTLMWELRKALASAVAAAEEGRLSGDAGENGGENAVENGGENEDGSGRGRGAGGGLP
ncbi:hypothetical protein GCM10010252_43720 [Streptomyces aureoverticillatus]|nr:hypothetical protein GCM10010252_43720 [Streptomyces aureoverticillatus]